MYGRWDTLFLECQPSIEYLELYGVTAAVLQWIRRFQNKKICLFCDNISVVHMINNMSSSCGHCMILLRLVVLEGLRYNVKITARYINTKKNGRADALSRLDFDRFFRLSKANIDEEPTSPPERIWPVNKIWFN